MTVADREAPGAPPARRGGSRPVARSGPLVDPGAELEARLAVLIALAASHGATERPMLASATVAAPSVDPIALFEAARALGLPARCWIQGFARLAFVAIDEAWAVEPERLHNLNRYTPFAGGTFTGRVVASVVRGQTVFDRRVDGSEVFLPPGTGRFVRREEWSPRV